MLWLIGIVFKFLLVSFLKWKRTAKIHKDYPKQTPGMPAILLLITRTWNQRATINYLVKRLKSICVNPQILKMNPMPRTRRRQKKYLDVRKKKVTGIKGEKFEFPQCNPLGLIMPPCMSSMLCCIINALSSTDAIRDLSLPISRRVTTINKMLVSLRFSPRLP